MTDRLLDCGVYHYDMLYLLAMNSFAVTVNHTWLDVDSLPCLIGLIGRAPIRVPGIGRRSASFTLLFS